MQLSQPYTNFDNIVITDYGAFTTPTVVRFSGIFGNFWELSGVFKSFLGIFCEKNLNSYGQLITFLYLLLKISQTSDRR
jgi:hypothetical protein